MTTNQPAPQLADLPEHLATLAPFAHDIQLGPDSWTAPDIKRVRNLSNLLFPPLLAMFGGTFQGLRMLDVACNCGGFSLLARHHGAREVVGVDARPHHITQAQAITDHLGVDRVTFQVGQLQQLSADTHGHFDVVLLLGILYHLQDPIGAMQTIAALSARTLVIDSHLHFDADPVNEDKPQWWMTYDGDAGVPDGLFTDDDIAAWADFQSRTPVDYTLAPRQFTGTVQTRREHAFVASRSKRPRHEPDLASATGELVMVPNRRALIDLLRYCGYDDIVEVVPQRFAPLPYLRRYRTCLIATRRQPDGAFPASHPHRRDTEGQR